MYEYKKEFNGSFKQACEKAAEELKKEGFGILTEIDVKKTLKKKLNEEFDNYKILGACNPVFAFKALNAEKEIGLFMPCNVIVFEDKEKVFVSAVLPSIMMNIVENEKLEKLAVEVEIKLKKVIDEL
ncbi:DUF302 domain-containing protein [Candidatus Micrarchaeota archaeon]|nr:DUF302 domain-containing protein [Candidatus Micrarchaeota archaeon]MBU2476282.1 DUF302 domain-containing protein [Candidatus Micrarchaeota archaeon]